MARWICAACGYIFDEDSPAPSCPSCHAAGAKISPYKIRRDTSQAGPRMTDGSAGRKMDLANVSENALAGTAGNRRGSAEGELSDLSRAVAAHVTKNAVNSKHLKKLTDGYDENCRREVEQVIERKETDVGDVLSRCRKSTEAAKSKALAEIEGERAKALNQRQERERGKDNQKKTLLKRLMVLSNLSVICAVVLYVLLLIGLFYLMQNNMIGTSILVAHEEGVKTVDMPDLLLLIFIILPSLSLVFGFIVEGIARFEKWFYGIDRRNRQISASKVQSTGQSFKETSDYLNEQEAIVRKAVRVNNGNSNLPCVEQFFDEIDEISAEAKAEEKRLTEKCQADQAEIIRTWDERKRTERSAWISETTQAAVSCAEYFEYRYRDIGIDRGPAFWLVFRFCERNGVIAQAPRGISQLRTVITINVTVSEKMLFVQIRDINGKELVHDPENQTYQFSRVNQADLTDPAERYGYANALMFCTVNEAKKILEQAGYDRTFDLQFSGADLDGFTLTYDGTL